MEKMSILIKKYPDRGLLPVFEGLVESGKEKEAYKVGLFT
jgi:hypothetical protein